LPRPTPSAATTWTAP